MGDVLAADFKAKRYLGKVNPVETPLETGLAIIAEAISSYPASIDDIVWPGMDSANYVAPEKDPA